MPAHPRRARLWPGSGRAARLIRSPALVALAVLAAAGPWLPASAAVPAHPGSLRPPVASRSAVPARPAGPGLVTAGAVVAPSALVRPEEGQVYRLYQAALGRAPDDAGFGYWAARRVEGVPLATVAVSFLASREFALRFDAATDTAYVDLLYRNVLGRDGDAAGAAYWRQQLAAGLSRDGLLLLFSESVELQLLTGTRLPDLPPYESSVRTVAAADLPSSWRAGCPVGPADLRAVEVAYVDFAGTAQRGTLVVHRTVADAVATIFGQLYQARFPLASVRPVDDFGGDDDASMAADNTSAFNCRRVTGGNGWSRHAYGQAIDINPIENPYVLASTVLPPAGAPWADRNRHHPGLIRPGDVVTAAFAAAGWRWGGTFSTAVDYQHFQR